MSSEPSAWSRSLAAAKEAASSGDRAAARVSLRPALEELEALPVDELSCLPSLLEELGLVGEAIRACRRLLELEPRALETWDRLAELHAEFGDEAAEAICRRRAALLRGEEPPEPTHEREVDPADRDAVEVDHPEAPPAELARMLDLFGGREGVHARQWLDRRRNRGGWSPVHEPLGPAALRRHLDGHQTLGVYLVRHDDSVKLCVLDLDLEREEVEQAAGHPERLEELARHLEDATARVIAGLAGLDVPFLLEDSGYKGRHFWIFFGAPVQAAEALGFGRAAAVVLAPNDPLLHLEFFPKQGKVPPGGLGNLVKLPLGRHKVSGRRGELLDAAGAVERRPFAAMARVRRLEAERLGELTRRLREQAAELDARTSPEPSPSGRGRAAPAPRRPAPPPWTAEDFEQDPEVSAVLAGCTVLRRLVDRALAGDGLPHDAVTVLRHTLGHLDSGPRAVNFLLERLPGVLEAQRLGRVLRGHPASCETIARRVPGTVRRAGCECGFGGLLATYPNPLLHAPDRLDSVRLVDEEDGLPILRSVSPALEPVTVVPPESAVPVPPESVAFVPPDPVAPVPPEE